VAKTLGYIIITFSFHKEGNRWVGRCNELTPSAFARTLKEAEERLKKLVQLHLNGLEDLGERERFFRENGITFYTNKPKLKNISVTAPLDKKTFVQPRIQPILELARA
jgi:predicted RNase H-like HicB family nuclease